MERVVAQHQVVVEGGVEGRVTDHDVERIGVVGHWLELSHCGLRGASAVEHHHRRHLREFIAETQERREIPYPPLRNGALGVAEVC